MAISTFISNLTIRTKLILLAGIPVIGSLLLALQIVYDAQVQVQKNKSLGTIEHVALLSERMGKLVNELQAERALAAWLQGQRAAINPDSVDAVLAAPMKQRHLPIETTLGAFREQAQLTLVAEKGLSELVSAENLKRLPQRLATDVREATLCLDKLQSHRTQLSTSTLELAQTVEPYQTPIRALIEGIAALSELTDNGELLRLTTSLVSIIQLKERGSQQHALLVYVLEAGRFPPGSYRTFVTLVTEENTYLESFRTTASSQQLRLYQTTMTKDRIDNANQLRALALENAEDGLNTDADVWFDAQRKKILQMTSVESALHKRVGEVALLRISETRRAQWGSAILTAAVILVSVLLAAFIARGITKKITSLRDAALQVGKGNLAIRVKWAGTDELSALGNTFNGMVDEIARTRAALSNQIRMARELEIAASLQRALLPPAPSHADFDFAGRMQPADEMGGDFYDVLRDESTTNLWLTVGDVSGHGLDAGLVMLMTQTVVASQFNTNPLAPPNVVLKSVNRLLCENISERLKDKKYVTAQVFAYRGQGRFVAAGAHQPTIVYRARLGVCELVEVTGYWLGIDPSITSSDETTIVLSSGDILCLYTDGLHEARNSSGELFDIPRLLRTIADSAKRYPNLDDIADHVFSEVAGFAPIPDDDRTMLLARYREPTNA
jgi:serine phosphatase RsbU (regulator of sigma subunit)